jgi:hypothetical protein
MSISLKSKAHREKDELPDFKLMNALVKHLRKKIRDPIESDEFFNLRNKPEL